MGLAAILFLAPCALLAGDTAGHSKKSPNSEKQAVLQDNVKLRELHAAYKKAAPGAVRGVAATASQTKKQEKAQSQKLQELKDLVQARREKLEHLIQEHPQAALEAALSSNEKTEFPVQVQSELETHVDKTGSLEVFIADDFEHNQSEAHFSVVADQKRFDLHFAGQEPNAISGARVRVKGVELGGHIAVPK
ncbi:MAG: hypothetical protein HY401_01775 [Elusimicrobia bacterium]|nr:hypothetical protein [Elusimicrobiota bacterium]